MNPAVSACAGTYCNTLSVFDAVESLLLNAELVCMFDPIKLDELVSVVFECNACAERVEQRQRQAMQLLSQDIGSQERK